MEVYTELGGLRSSLMGVDTVDEAELILEHYYFEKLEVSEMDIALICAGSNPFSPLEVVWYRETKEDFFASRILTVFCVSYRCLL